MSPRFFSKSWTSEIPEPENASERRSMQEIEEDDPEREAAALLRTRIPATLQAIGSNLDRTLSVLQRMERKLGVLTQ